MLPMGLRQTILVPLSSFE